MSTNHTTGVFGSWSDAMVEGYVTVLLKGSPYVSHAKRPGEISAACGKKPGPKNPHTSHKNRTGWRMFTDARPPSCEACMAAITKATGRTK